MTLITRISNESRAFIASDDQLNDRNRNRSGTIVKAFLYSKSIGAVSGLINDKTIDFNILDICNKYDSFESLNNGIAKDIPDRFTDEEIVILLSTLHNNKICDYAIVRKSGNQELLLKSQKLFLNQKTYQLISNNYKEIYNSFDPNIYAKYVDFNFSYSNGYDNFFHSILHIVSYNFFLQKTQYWHYLTQMKTMSLILFQLIIIM